MYGHLLVKQIPLLEAIETQGNRHAQDQAETENANQRHEHDRENNQKFQNPSRPNADCRYQQKRDQDCLPSQKYFQRSSQDLLLEKTELQQKYDP